MQDYFDNLYEAIKEFDKFNKENTMTGEYRTGIPSGTNVVVTDDDPRKFNTASHCICLSR